MREKTRVILLTILMAAIVTVIAFAALGCQSTAARGQGFINATGSGVDQATAYVKAADGAVQNAKQHVDAAGNALLGVATANHTSALAELVAVKADLAGIQDSFHKLEAEYNQQVDQVTALEHSWGHRLQVYVTAAFWILVGLVAAHFVLGALAIFLPPPYSTICGLISKIINPFGWFTWLVVKLEKNVAAKVPQVQVVHG